jgi:hypothetical protein
MVNCLKGKAFRQHLTRAPMLGKYNQTMPQMQAKMVSPKTA